MSKQARKLTPDTGYETSPEGEAISQSLIAHLQRMAGNNDPRIVGDILRVFCGMLVAIKSSSGWTNNQIVKFTKQTLAGIDRATEEQGSH